MLKKSWSLFIHPSRCHITVICFPVLVLSPLVFCPPKTLSTKGSPVFLTAVVLCPWLMMAPSPFTSFSELRTSGSPSGLSASLEAHWVFYSWVHPPSLRSVGETLLSGGMKCMLLPLCVAGGNFWSLIEVVDIKWI